MTALAALRTAPAIVPLRRWQPAPVTATGPLHSLAFVNRILPSGIFSGPSRERAMLALWTVTNAAAKPVPTPVHSRQHLTRLLHQLHQAQPAEHWLSLQSLFFPGAPGCTAAHTRFLTALVLDLDGHRMEPDWARLRQVDLAAFAAALDAVLAPLGIGRWELVLSSPNPPMKGVRPVRRTVVLPFARLILPSTPGSQRRESMGAAFTARPP